MTLEEIKANKQYWKDTGIANGVYFLFDRDELIYIGSSFRTYERINYHKRTGLIDFDSFYFFETETMNRKDLYILEADFIIAFKPPLNKVIPGIHSEPSKEDTKDINKTTVKDAVNFNYKDYVLEQEKIIRGKR